MHVVGQARLQEGAQARHDAPEEASLHGPRREPFRIVAVGGPRRTEGRKKIAYFRGNAHAMRYAEFRAMDLFVGSGVIEAGCKSVIGRRLKQSGMFWSERGANAIIALRCCDLSGRWEAFWEARAG